MIEFQVLCTSNPPRMETNPIRRSLDDLAQRCTALRGFL